MNKNSSCNFYEYISKLKLKVLSKICYILKNLNAVTIFKILKSIGYSLLWHFTSFKRITTATIANTKITNTKKQNKKQKHCRKTFFVMFFLRDTNCEGKINVNPNKINSFYKEYSFYIFSSVLFLIHLSPVKSYPWTKLIYPSEKNLSD
jgi:hypothetical protein